MEMQKGNRLVLLLVAVLLAFLSSQLLPAVSKAQEQTITAKEAADHFWEVQTVCGTVASARFASQSKNQPTFLNLDEPVPDQIFTIVIWGSARSKFSQAPELLYRGKRICVKGMIKEYRGKPAIVVNDPSQITVEPSR